MGSLGAIVLFVSVLVHELAHSVVCIRYGIRVRQIILFVFGGISDIQEEAQDFHKEFKIAVAGPVTSFVLAAIFALLWKITVVGLYGTTTSTMILSQHNSVSSVGFIAIGVLLYAAVVNALLGAFNLVPAFPLDGGRILRAALVSWKKDYDQSTRIAVKVGIAISYVFIAFGFLTLFTSGSFISGIWLILIGWFLQTGAQSYMYQYEISSILSKVRLQDIMNTRIVSVSSGTSVNQLLRNYFNIYMKSAFPIVNKQNHLQGMVTLKDVQNVPDYDQENTKVEDIMIPAAELIIMQPTRRADEALRKMTRTRLGRVCICDEEGRLVGLVSKTDIMNAAGERQHYIKETSKKYSNSDTEDKA